MTKLEERSDEELMEGIRGGEQECMDVLIERYNGAGAQRSPYPVPDWR